MLTAILILWIGLIGDWVFDASGLSDPTHSPVHFTTTTTTFPTKFLRSSGASGKCYQGKEMRPENENGAQGEKLDLVWFGVGRRCIGTFVKAPAESDAVIKLTGTINRAARKGLAMADFKVTQLEPGLDFEHLPYWDVVIIGAGPAGLAASLTTAHRALTTLVIEAKDRPGGQPQFLYADKRIVDIPGFPDGITGEELSQRTFRQAKDALVQFRFNEELASIEDTDQVENEDRLKRIVTTKGSCLCRKAIIACGLLHYPRKLAVLDELQSKNVHYKFPKIGDYEGSRVAVVGGGDSALDAALMVQARSGLVDLIVREATPIGKADSLAQIREAGGRIHTSTEIRTAKFEGNEIALELTNGEGLTCSLAIVQIGFLSAKDTFQRLALVLNEDGSIAVDPYFETSRKGIFAVGDVHGDIKLIAVAWAEGIQAAIHAFKEITSPYWLNEKRLKDHKIALIGEKIARAASATRKT
jgi:thioredoxin reductase